MTPSELTDLRLRLTASLDEATALADAGVNVGPSKKRVTS